MAITTTAISTTPQVIVTGDNLVARASELGDYKLYTLPFATTVEPRQMKQARLLDRHDVRFERLYEYRVTEAVLDQSTPESARSLLRLTNTKRMGLGVPLPAGTWRIMETRSDGRQYFVGEHSLDDTPVDLPRDIELGDSNDVTVVSRMTEEAISQDDGERSVVEVEIGNAGARAVNVEVLHSQQFPENGRIVKASHPHHTKEGDYVWSLRVPANERTVLRYTLVKPDRN